MEWSLSKKSKSTDIQTRKNVFLVLSCKKKHYNNKMQKLYKNAVENVNSGSHLSKKNASMSFRSKCGH